MATVTRGGATVTFSRPYPTGRVDIDKLISPTAPRFPVHSPGLGEGNVDPLFRNQSLLDSIAQHPEMESSWLDISGEDKELLLGEIARVTEIPSTPEAIREDLLVAVSRGMLAGRLDGAIMTSLSRISYILEPHETGVMNELRAGLNNAATGALWAKRMSDGKTLLGMAEQFRTGLAGIVDAIPPSLSGATTEGSVLRLASAEGGLEANAFLVGSYDRGAGEFLRRGVQDLQALKTASSTSPFPVELFQAFLGTATVEAYLIGALEASVAVREAITGTTLLESPPAAKKP